jgi:hypothetical protein
MLFLVDQLTREPQGRADVLHGQVVLPLHFLEAHAAGQAAYHDRHGSARTPNDRLAVADCRINRNSVIHAAVRVLHGYRMGKHPLMRPLQAGGTKTDGVPHRPVLRCGF